MRLHGQPDDQFTIWANEQPTGPGQLRFRGAMLKKGQQVAKVVTVADFGDQATGVLSKRELRFRTVPRRADGIGYDFDNPERTWACENDEVEKLLAFLHSDVAATGRYRVVDTESPLAVVLDMVDVDVDASTLVQALVGRTGADGVAAALASTQLGLSVAEGAVIRQRRELVARLRAMAQDPVTTETDMQREIGDAHWLFGGRYVGVADRRNIGPLDQHDIPLLGADGTLHIVELKGPNAPKLVRRHRNHYIVGDDVHAAASQAINYLRTLDELGAGLTTTYRNEFDVEYDMRRVFATVLIGHPTHVPDIEERVVDQTLRTYNSHLSRVEVLSYASLRDAAQRALEFEETARTAQPTTRCQNA